MQALLKPLMTRLSGLLRRYPEPVKPVLDEDQVDPTAWAEYFVARLRSKGYRLDYSLSSLETEVDVILSSSLFLNYNQIVAQANPGPGNRRHKTREFERAQAEYQLYLEYETGLSAYIGETLRRAYHVDWQGPFAAHGPLRNQYLSLLELEGHHYYPSRYPASRLSGPHREQGSLRQQLQALLARDAKASA